MKKLGYISIGASILLAICLKLLISSYGNQENGKPTPKDVNRSSKPINDRITDDLEDK